jgi:hypothetical protein
MAPLRNYKTPDMTRRRSFTYFILSSWLDTRNLVLMVCSTNDYTYTTQLEQVLRLSQGLGCKA